MHIRPFHKESFRNSIYLRCTINGRSTLCLVDTGSEISLIPLDIAAGMPLHPTERLLLAANATEIRVAGELTIPVKLSGGCHLEATFWSPTRYGKWVWIGCVGTVAGL